MRGASGSERRGERRIEREEKKIDDREMIDEREEKRDRDREERDNAHCVRVIGRERLRD
tara:strand:+ start:273 stop:449 length:177 start_codon:yes stop_codon:yes gene_type:complete